MANILGNKYGNPRFVDSIVKSLSPRERKLLTRIAIHSDSMVKPILRDINRKIVGEDKLYPREEELSMGLDVLMRWGLVFVVGLGSHVIYYIPSDLMDTLRQVKLINELFIVKADEPSPLANSDVYSRRFGFIFKYTDKGDFLMGIDGYIPLTHRIRDWL